MPDLEVVINYNFDELPPVDFMWCLNGNRKYLFCCVSCSSLQSRIVENSVCHARLVRPAI
jgi:hypothetical protein